MKLPLPSKALALTLGATLLAACGGPEPTSAIDERRAPIVNGQYHDGHPAVGGLVQGKGGMCTATLVGQRTVLTAAHCVTPGAYHIFFLDNKRWEVEGVVRHPGYSEQTIGDDIAVVRLKQAPSIAPMPIGVAPPALNQKVSLIGYGATSHQGGGSGFKRIAQNTVAVISSRKLTFRFASGEVGNLCFGDSGGPTFAIINGQEVQVGVHSYIRGVCGQEGNDMRVDYYRDWILKNAGGDVLEGGHPDKEAPTVSFTAPKADDELYKRISVAIDAKDNTAVTKVELLLDGKVVGERDSAPYEFEVDVEAGPRALEARAFDAAGNSAKAQLQITVSAPKVFGEFCGGGLECGSDLCASHPELEQAFCTQSCDPQGDPCPGDAMCVDAGSSNFVCGPPAALLPTPPSSGCAVSGNAQGGAATGLTLLLLLGFALLRRR